jgi:hypothetical protein
VLRHTHHRTNWPPYANLGFSLRPARNKWLVISTRCCRVAGPADVTLHLVRHHHCKATLLKSAKMTGWRGGEHRLHTWQHGPACVTELWGNVTRCSAARSDDLGFDTISLLLSASHSTQRQLRCCHPITGVNVHKELSLYALWRHLGE